jgi:hypothetical protein
MEEDHQHASGRQVALRVLHYTLPLSIFIYYAFACLVSVCFQRKEGTKPAPREALAKSVYWLMISVLLTYVGLIQSIPKGTRLLEGSRC